MRSLYGGIFGAASVFFAGAALAQPTGGASAAVRESAEGLAALAQSGVKTAVGTVLVPVTLAAGASEMAAGSGLSATDASSRTPAAMSGAVRDGAAYSAAPLTVDDEVIVAPQPAPRVPFHTPAPRPRS